MGTGVSTRKSGRLSWRARISPISASRQYPNRRWFKSYRQRRLEISSVDIRRIERKVGARYILSPFAESELGSSSSMSAKDSLNVSS